MLRDERARNAGLLALLAALIVLILVTHPAARPVRRAQELGVYVLLLLTCLNHAPLRATLLGMGGLRAAMMATFVALAVFGQLYKFTTRTYPFVTWAMYASKSPSQTYVRHSAVLTSGRVVDFPFSRLNASNSVRAFATSFHTAARTVARLDEGDPRKRTASAALGRTFAEVVAVHNRRHPSEAIAGVRSALCVIPSEDVRGPESVSCRPVAAYHFRGSR